MSAGAAAGFDQHPCSVPFQRHDLGVAQQRRDHCGGLGDISISELSRQSECHVEMIRYYERIGLLPKPRREGRFRRYGADDVATLRFIRRARQLGFNLENVRTPVRLAAVPGQPLRAEARQLAAAHVEEVRAKIADLQAMERILTGAICQCDAGRGPACPIIEVISGTEIA